MFKVLACSKLDPVGSAAAKLIVDRYSLERVEPNVYLGRIGKASVELRLLDVDSIYADELDRVNADLIVFLSRHEARSPRPMLLVHPPGNLTGEARFGGKPRSVAVASANAMAHALRRMDRLNKELKLGYQVSYEATHHGPSLSRPTLFVEVGSTPREWSDVKALSILVEAAEAAVEACFEDPASLGLGGPHYNSKFTRLCLDGGYAFGHILPKYAAGECGREVFKMCIERTVEKVRYAVFDWKGLKSRDRNRFLEYAEELRLEVIRV